MIDIENRIADKRFGCKILLHNSKGKGAEPKKMHFWTGLKFDIYNKYRWYFRYRTALLQVQYPMRFVELETFQYDYIPTEIELRKRLKDKITGNKAKLTIWKNKVADYEKGFEVTNRNSLFKRLIEADESWQKASAKIRAFEQKIKGLEKELLNFDNN